MTGIGSLNEKPLHASLKVWCARPGDRFEAPVDGFVVDIVRDGLLLEIQTRSFASIKAKLVELTRRHRVRLVYPVAGDKWIIKPAGNERGGVTRRRSPRRGRVEDVFQELVSFPALLGNPNFSLEVVLTREEESRRYAGKRAWRTKGWVTEERRLVGVEGQRLFRTPRDWRALLPVRLKEPFTVRDLAGASGIGRHLAEKMAYCLRKAGVIRLTGKRGHANLYETAVPSARHARGAEKGRVRRSPAQGQGATGKP